MDALYFTAFLTPGRADQQRALGIASCALCQPGTVDGLEGSAATLPPLLLDWLDFEILWDKNRRASDKSDREVSS